MSFPPVMCTHAWDHAPCILSICTQRKAAEEWVYPEMSIKGKQNTLYCNRKTLGHVLSSFEKHVSSVNSRENPRENPPSPKISQKLLYSITWIEFILNILSHLIYAQNFLSLTNILSVSESIWEQLANRQDFLPQLQNFTTRDRVKMTSQHQYIYLWTWVAFSVVIH